MIAVLLSALLLTSHKIDVPVQRSFSLSSKPVQLLKLSLIDIMEIMSSDDVIDGLVDRSTGEVVKPQAIQIMIPAISFTDIGHSAFG